MSSSGLGLQLVCETGSFTRKWQAGWLACAGFLNMHGCGAASLLNRLRMIEPRSDGPVEGPTELETARRLQNQSVTACDPAADRSDASRRMRAVGLTRHQERWTGGCKPAGCDLADRRARLGQWPG